MTLKITKWDEFQHYKDRCPPWIKLHFSLLSSEDWVCLDAEGRMLAVVCMLLASRHKDRDGSFNDDPLYVKRVAYLDALPNFKPLIKCGFLTETLADASGCKRMQAKATTETETETEKPSRAIVPSSSHEPDEPRGFSDCWKAYPKRTGGNSRKEAEKAYRARLKAGVDPNDLLAGVQRYAAFVRAEGKEGTAYVKQASTFFGPGEHWKESYDAHPGLFPESTDWRENPTFKGCA